jgi:hypothetical protein
VKFHKLFFVSLGLVCLAAFFYVYNFTRADTLDFCTTISTPGSYTLTQDVGDGSSVCFTITTDGVSIDGNGFTINGIIDANNTDGVGGSGYSLTLTNVTVMLDISMNGSSNSTDGEPGGSGGNLTGDGLFVYGNTTSTGGAGAGGAPGGDGVNCECEDGDGGDGESGGSGGNGGSGGTVVLYGNSSLTGLDTSGGAGGGGGNGGNGGSGGSNSGNPGNTGGAGTSGNGGNGGNFYRSLSASASLTSNGGSGNINGTNGETFIGVPSVTITAPSGTVSGTAVSFTATAADFVGPPVAGVSFYVGETLIGSEDTSSPYGLTFNSTNFTDGSNTIYAVARNTSNIYATTSATISIDNTPPVISSVASTTYDTGAVITFNAGEGGIGKLYYGTSTGNYTVSSTTVGSFASPTLTLRDVLDSSTRYYFIVTATDAQGNTSTSSEYSFLTKPWKKQTASGSRVWTSIASSDDGTKLAAVVNNGNIYLSTDSGTTWSVATNAGSRSWRHITSSADGTKLVATVTNSSIYYSTDSGATWTASNSGSRNWGQVDSSSDGSKLIASAGFALNLFYSTDYGATWASTTAAGARDWTSVAISADGTRMLAGVNTGDVYKSLNSGATWGPNGITPRIFTSVSMSSNGTKMFAALQTTNFAPDYIYYSVNSGSNWSFFSNLGVKSWNSIDVSSDGSVIVAGVTNGNIYLSTDSGITWTAQTDQRSWQEVAVSSDGSKIAAIATNSYIYTYPEIVDSTAPTVSITAPANAATITGSSVSFTADSSDAVGVSGVKFYIDSTLISAEDTAAPYAVTLDSTSYLDGAHTLIAVSRDEVGNIATSTSVSVTIDNTGPTFSTISAGSPTQISANLSWNTNEAATTQVDYGLTTSYSSQTTLDSSLTSSHTVTLSSLSSNTTYHYRLRGTDSSGNSSLSSDQTFTTGAGAFFSFAPQVGLNPGQSTPQNPPSLSNPNTSNPIIENYSPYYFSRNLKFGDSGIIDIKYLQQYLNFKNFTVSNSGPGSSGNETTFFGTKTQSALSRFQSAISLTPSGFFGELTRRFINSGLTVETPIISTTTLPILPASPVATTTNNPQITTPIVSIATSSTLGRTVNGICVISYYFTKPVELGKANNRSVVIILQNFLNKYEGNTLVTDGVYKLADQKAVIKFQEKYGLMAQGDGIVTLSTISQIKKVIGGCSGY